MLKRILAVLSALCAICVGVGAAAEGVSLEDGGVAIRHMALAPLDDVRLDSRFGLSDATDTDRAALVASQLVIQRAQALGVDPEELETPEKNWKERYNSVCDACLEGAMRKPDEAVFDGRTVSGLNAFLREDGRGRKVLIESPTLVLDETLSIPDETFVAGREVHLIPGESPVTRAVLLDGVHNGGLSGFVIRDAGCEYGIYAKNASGFAIVGNEISGCGQEGIVVIGSGSGFMVYDNVVCRNGCGGVIVRGDYSEGVLERNRVMDNACADNMAAGIVLSGVAITDIDSALGPFEHTSIASMLVAPHSIVVYDNLVCGNNSSGIYSYAGYLNDIVSNRIIRNEKEGMCLDFGTLGCYVAYNDIAANGGRYRMSDADLEVDCVAHFGRMEDGSSPAKLPGISLDNAAFNTLYDNRVSGNYGSGIKGVRAAYLNRILCNEIVDNNVGINDIHHFFGIELASDLGTGEELDCIDYSPCHANFICRNTISGAHYAGIFLGEEGSANVFRENTIFDGTDWSMEFLSKQKNDVEDNRCDLPSRGVNFSLWPF